MSYLFLDIDGVLNPYRTTHPGDGWVNKTVAGYRMWVNHDITERLLATEAQIVWATMWVTEPRSLVAAAKAYKMPTRLPRIDSTKVDYRGWNSGYRETGKRPGLIHYLNENGIDPYDTPCVWVDDQLGRGDLLWAQARGVHTVRPEHTTGLGDQAVFDKVCNLLTIEGVAA